MIKIKKKIFFVIKSAFALVIFLTLVLFFYAAFFFDPSSIERKTVKNEIIEEEQIIEEEEKKIIEEKRLIEEERLKEEEKQKLKEKTKIKQVKTTLKDGLYATVGNKAITRSDIVNEIKSILILNNMSYSDDKRQELQQMAVKSVIKRNIKEIEIDKNDFLQFSETDLNFHLNRLASNANVDLATLKNICASNGLDFSIIENQMKTELLWNSLIFHLYRNKISVNLSEIDKQLKLNQNKKEFNEYLISEIVVKAVEKDKLESMIIDIKKRIEVEGFQNIAMKLSLSESATSGGDLGWLNEKEISTTMKSTIINTPVGELSEAILLPEGILLFKIRDKRQLFQKLTLEERKNQLINFEKIKILKMHSLSHYDTVRRSTSIKFFK